MPNKGLENTRRDFIKNSGLALTYYLLFDTLIGCSKKDKQLPTEPTTKPTTTVYNIYETFSNPTNSDGFVTLVNRDLEEVKIKIIDRNGTPLSSIKVYYHRTKRSNQDDTFIVAEDSTGVYLHGLEHSTKLKGLGKNQDLVQIALDQIKELKYIKIARKFKQDNFFNFNKKDYLLSIPGFRYVGEYNFQDIQNLNYFLNVSAKIITVLVPNPYTGTIAAATEKADKILNFTDELLEIIGSTFNIEMDKYKKERFEFYVFDYFPLLVISPIIGINIRNYIDISQGNWWKFKIPGSSSLLEVKVNGYRNIDGKYVPKIVQSDGIIAYQGYDGNLLKTYGFELPSAGFIKLNNPVVFGDHELQINKSFTTNTSYSGVSGYSETQKYTYEKLPVLAAKEDLSLRCWQLKNEVTNSRGNYAAQTAWLSKNIGQIKIKNPSNAYITLVEAYIAGKLYSGFKPSFKEDHAGSQTNLEGILIGAASTSLPQIKLQQEK